MYNKDLLDGVCGIYGLCDPRDMSNVLYVGQARDIGQRVKAHLDMNRYEPNLDKFRWLRSLASLGLRPKIIILARCKPGDLNRLEAACIRAYRSCGMATLNHVQMRTIFHRKALIRLRRRIRTTPPPHGSTTSGR
jgi:hypothetical protein